VSAEHSQAERLDSYQLRIGPALGGFLLLLALVGIAWVWFGVVKLDRWPIRWLEVDGAFERVSAEQLRKAMAPLVDDNFFAVDPAALRTAARELPWVNQVYVQKRWPDTVAVVVTEYVPVAHWTDDQLIATNGDSFRVPGAASIQGLPWLEGPQGSAETVIETWLQFNEVLTPTGQEIERITLNLRGAWTLVLNGGTRVELGRDEALPRLERMTDSWNQLQRMHEQLPLLMDLRYTNGFAVRWPEAPPEPAASLADNR